MSDFYIDDAVKFLPHASVSAKALACEDVHVTGYAEDGEHVLVEVRPVEGRPFEQTVLPNEIELR